MSASRSVSKQLPETKAVPNFDVPYPPFHPVILGERTLWRKVIDMVREVRS